MMKYVPPVMMLSTISTFRLWARSARKVITNLQNSIREKFSINFVGVVTERITILFLGTPVKGPKFWPQSSATDL
jgi:hypothetical protein